MTINNQRRRTRFEIFQQILSSILKNKQAHGTARPTRVQGNVNVPYDRFRIYLDELAQKGLITVRKDETGDDISLTEKGLEFLHRYDVIEDFLKMFGLN